MQEPLVPPATSDSSVSPKPHSSTITMEAREGRSGNAFACERCKGPAKLHAPFFNFEQVVSTRFDVFPQTPLAYAKGMFFRYFSAPTE